MLSWSERIPVLAAICMLAVAGVIAFGVIAPVRVDTYPAATPDRAVPAFWANVV